MAELNTITLSDFVKLGEVLFAKGLQSVPLVIRNSGLYKIMEIPEHSGNSREFSEIDGEQFAKLKGEGDQSERAKVQQGYNVTMTNKRIAMDISITYEMRHENKYPEIMSRLTNLGYQASNRMELDMTHQITFGATATTYTDLDGVSRSCASADGHLLFDTDHSLKGSSTTYRNILANNPRLSKGALEGIERLVTENTYNQFAEKMVMPFDIIFTSDDPNTVNTAREYLQSTADVEGANSGVINVYKAKYRHVILPYLATTATGAVDTTKRYYWGIASSQYPSLILGIWENPHLKVPANLNAGEDFETDDFSFGVRAGYGIVATNATGIKLSKGDGSA